jgi:hypothetical protein
MSGRKRTSLPLFWTVLTVAFGVIGLGMLTAAVFVLIGARQPFVGVLLAAMGVAAFVIAFLTRRYH